MLLHFQMGRLFRQPIAFSILSPNFKLMELDGTLTELNEISSVKILIEGEEGKGFLNGDINFNSPFERVDQVF